LRVRGFVARLGFAFFSVMALDHASGDQLIREPVSEGCDGVRG